MLDAGYWERARSLNRAPKRSMREALEAAEAERREEEEELPVFGRYKKKPYWEDDLDSDQEF